MLALARSAEEVFGPGVRVRVTDEQHDPRYGRTRGRKLLTGPTIAVPCQSISTGWRVSKLVRGGKKCHLVDFGGAQPKLALELVDHERDPAQVFREEIRKHCRRQTGAEGCLQPARWPED